MGHCNREGQGCATRGRLEGQWRGEEGKGEAQLCKQDGVSEVSSSSSQLTSLLGMVHLLT